MIDNAVSEIDIVALQDELISFASSNKDPKKGLLENMNDNENDSNSLELNREYTEVGYENLYAAYKFIVILSITQCTWERCFSKLRLLKTRLRSSLTQNNLESLMLIAFEKDIARKIKSNKDEIIDKVAGFSPEISTMLLL